MPRPPGQPARPDPHAVLGVPRHATPDQIRTAYRRLARLHHPDVSKAPDAAARFAAIADAYERLTAPNPPRDPHAPPAHPAPTPDPDAPDPAEAAEVYDTFFASDAARARPRRRPPYRPVPGTPHLALDLPLTPAEAARGTTVTVPTPAGPHPLTIPAATPDGAEFRIPGVVPGPTPARPRADLIVRIRLTPASGADPL